MLSPMLESPPPPSFLDTYKLSTLSFRCKALYKVIHFLVIWSISWSSLVHLKSGSEYLTGGTAQAFILSMGFLLYSLVLNRFIVLLRYSFLNFNLINLILSFISTCLYGVRFHYCFWIFVNFLFLRVFWFFIDLVILFLPSCVVSCFL